MVWYVKQYVLEWWVGTVEAWKSRSLEVSKSHGGGVGIRDEDACWERKSTIIVSKWWDGMGWDGMG